MGSDKEFAKAQHALIDPLNEPDPSDETGLNSHFGSTFAPRQGPPSPPGSAGLKDMSSASIRHQHTGSTIETNPFRRSRASSVTNSPSAANRGGTPRRRKKNFQGADVIDRLDKTGFSYHHEGPYDAANMARNTNWKHSPIAAVRDSNEEALRATPRENIIDAVTKHRPLEGVAAIPPGVPDRFGRIYDYEEGTDLMREPGADYKRWPGVTYHPDDLKGKGEPSFTIERALKEHKMYGDSGTEMHTRRRNRSMGSTDTPGTVPVESLEASNGLGRSNTTGKSVGSALKKRFGSLRRRKVES